MANYAYIRVSTEEQSFARQFQIISDKLGGKALDKIVTEKKTTKSDFRTRTLYKLMTEAAPGSTIYVASLDRIGRSMSDILNIFEFADEHEIIFFDVKLGMQLEKRTPTGKMLLGVMAAFAEVERENIRDRTKEGLAAIKAEIAATGSHISKRSGQRITKLGAPDGLVRNTIPGVISQRVAADKWLEQSAAYKRACELYDKGMSNAQIAEELSTLYDLRPDVFCTRKGLRPTIGRVQWWIRHHLGTPYRARVITDEERAKYLDNE